MYGFDAGYTRVDGQPTGARERDLLRLSMLGNTWDVRSARCWTLGVLEALHCSGVEKHLDELFIMGADTSSR